MLGHLHFFAENRPSSISPSPLPLSMLYQWAESALFRSNIDQGGGGTSLCANATFQSVENRAISEHVSYFQAVPRTFVQDCSTKPDIVEKCARSLLTFHTKSACRVVCVLVLNVTIQRSRDWLKKENRQPQSIIHVWQQTSRLGLHLKSA